MTTGLVVGILLVVPGSIALAQDVVPATDGDIIPYYLEQLDRSSVQPIRLASRIKWFRVQLTIVKDATDWFITFSDASGEELQQVTSENLGTAIVWSKRFIGNKIDIRLHCETCPHVSVRQLAVQGQPPAQPQGITTSRNDLWPVKRVDAWVQSAAKSVVHLSYTRTVSQNRSVCSGFYISSTQLITNAHCFGDLSEACSAEISFDFDEGDYPSGSSPTRVKRLLAVDQRLDVALVETDPLAGGREPLQIEAPRLKSNDDLVVIQHPLGGSKKVAWKSCRVTDPDVPGRDGKSEIDLSHFCNTEKGSSGSPVFDRRTRTVVGVHHLEFSKAATAWWNRAVRGDHVKQFVERVGETSVGECRTGDNHE